MVFFALIVVVKTRFIPLFFIFLFYLVSFQPQVHAESSVERIIIISIDSMNNDFIFNEYENPDFILTPNIGILVRNGAAFTDAEAVMPTKTQVNHVTMVSGSYAEKIGVAGNFVLFRNKTSTLFWRKYVYPWKKPELIKADTIFKAMEREDPRQISAVVAGKNFVGRPIWADIQVGPGFLSRTAEDLGVKKFPEVQLLDAPDDWTMDNSLLVLESTNPKVMLINLAFLDPVQHIFGHGSMESWAALSWADHQVGRLLQYLKESGKIKNTLIVLTADHGQSNEWKSIAVGKILRKHGVKTEVVADGPFAHIFLKNEEDLEKAVYVLQGLDAVDGLWYGDSLDDIHIRTPYTGDIVVSLKPPYEAYSRYRDPFIGTHGGLQQRFVPLIFFGPNIKRGLVLENASLTDIVPTICEITGLPLPRDSQGSVLPIIETSLKTAPEITPRFEEYQHYTFSYISLIPFMLSILTMVPAFIVLRGVGHPWIDVNSKELSNIVPYLLSITSVILAMISSFFSYVVNLYSVPGIQPDSYLVSMDFRILGSFIVSMSLSLVIVWFAPLIVQVLIHKIRRKEIRIRTMPISIIILILSQLLYTSFNMMIRIPYSISFHVFIIFFFGGMGLSYIFRISMIRRYIEINRRKIIIWTISSGALNGIFWFYLLMFLLFPNYLFETGIVSIL